MICLLFLPSFDAFGAELSLNVNVIVPKSRLHYESDNDHHQNDSQCWELFDSMFASTCVPHEVRSNIFFTFTIWLYRRLHLKRLCRLYNNWQWKWSEIGNGTAIKRQTTHSRYYLVWVDINAEIQLNASFAAPPHDQIAQQIVGINRALEMCDEKNKTRRKLRNHCNGIQTRN